MNRFQKVRMGAGWAVWDRDTNHFVADASYGNEYMADAKVEVLNRKHEEQSMNSHA